jgi:hypothetical protein
MVKIAVIIPDRKDRPDFINHFHYMISKQTLQPNKVYVADWDAMTDKCDITQRYRLSYHMFDGMGFDCILFMENDDFYHETYIETMVNKWIEYGKPELFGTGYTYYYHIGIKKYMKLEHFKRASMMNTLIVPDLKINWTSDHDPYTDLCLWKQLKGVIFVPEKIISIGIKHNVGLSGGHYHGDKLHRYVHEDSNFDFLEKHTQCKTSINFYKLQHEKISNSFR